MRVGKPLGAVVVLCSLCLPATLVAAASNTADDDDRRPVAVVDAQPLNPRPGVSVVLDAGKSRPADAPIARYEWDLDGQPGFEVDGKLEPTIEQSWAEAGTVKVAVRVTDEDGRSDIGRARITVDEQGDPGIQPTGDDAAAQEIGNAPSTSTRQTGDRTDSAAAGDGERTDGSGKAKSRSGKGGDKTSSRTDSGLRVGRRQTAVRSQATTPAPSPSPSPSPSPTPAPRARAAADATVIIKDFEYDPDTVTINVGDTVTWTNEDPEEHTATADDGSFNTGLLAQGQSGSHTFNEAGTFSYFCEPHPTMKGTVIVEDSGDVSGITSGDSGTTDSFSSDTGATFGSDTSGVTSGTGSTGNEDLAFTGHDVTAILGLGAGLLVVGGVGLGLTRRRNGTAAQPPQQ